MLVLSPEQRCQCRIVASIRLLTAVQVGAFGYPFYVSGLWYYDAQGNEWYPLLGGAVLGITAAMLWTVSGFMYVIVLPMKLSDQSLSN